MGLVSKKIYFFFLGIFCLLNASAQVTLNMTAKPPFTPFLSDYTSPDRLNDIAVSIFNSTANEQRLKFKLSLKNAQKGIEISLKETTLPNSPFLLLPNEFRFLVLDELSGLYGSLNQSSFNIRGADIQNLILDGTIPDGTYEVCLQAFDFDAVGYSKPMSDPTSNGCFTFMVNYTDPPTDIRFSGNLLQYTFGGVIPDLGFNSALGQNYNIQFTAPALNAGSNYEYNLYIFDGNSINPNQQQLSSLMQGIKSINPIINKTSNVPFFIIDASDIQLDFNQNYFLLIEAVDLNEKTLFKNKGYSTFKAFRLFDTKPVNIPAPEISNTNCGKTVNKASDLLKFSWTIDDENVVRGSLRNEVETHVKIVSFTALGTVPDILESDLGETVFDTIMKNEGIGVIQTEIDLKGRFDSASTQNKRLVFALQLKAKNDSRIKNSLNFINNGKAAEQCEILVMQNQNTPPAAKTILTVTYPKSGDTIPFFYPPVVVKAENLTGNDKIVFTQFNSRLEPYESNKYLKTTTDVNFNNEINALGFDTALNTFSALMSQATKSQLEGDFNRSEELINQAKNILTQNAGRSVVQITHALNAKSIPLGNGVKSKQALASNIFRYQAATQTTDIEPILDFPNMKEMIYLMPFKDNISWMGKVGVYNTSQNNGMGLADYEDKFIHNSFSETDMRMDMLKDGFKTASGNFNVGMKSPILTKKNGDTLAPDSNIILSFLPSSMPAQLMPPTPDNNDVWREFEKMSVAQQWNLEISRDKNFKNIDTVISKKIIKEYELKNGTSAIINDLYARVNLTYKPKNNGIYFWRVTWSNVTASEKPNPQEIAYWNNLANLIANSELAGQITGYETNMDSFFYKRSNYRISDVDSFRVGPKNPILVVPKPSFEILYPLSGDTIPFYYPPIVIKKNPVDSNWKFALTEFNSTLEPFVNLNYFVFDTLSESGRAILNKNYDSLLKKNTSDFNAISSDMLLGDSPDEDVEGISEVVTNFKNNTEKRKNLFIKKIAGTESFPLGNSPVGKSNLVFKLMQNDANSQFLNPNDASLTQVSFSDLIYFKPYKSIEWSSRFAYYTDKGNDLISIDSFENLFVNKNLNANSLQSENLKNGLAEMTGNFHVGMKTPIITVPLSGKKVSKNTLKISFKPSEQPNKIFPTIETNESWKQFDVLHVAQQWNIEVSKSSVFDTLVYVKSKCIIDQYNIPSSQGKVMNDFYNPRAEILDSLPAGKYFYRITWSNPTAIDTNNQMHNYYFKTQVVFLSNDQHAGNEFELTDSLSNGFLGYTRENYKLSAIDSFEMVDSTIKTNDTAVCGLECSFALTSSIPRENISTTINVNEEIAVGNFTMKVKTISNIGTNYSGEGTILCKLFPKPVAVTFTNIKLNANKRMIDGVIRAKYKTAALPGYLVPENSSLFARINTVVGVNELQPDAKRDTLQQIYDLINSPLCLLIDELTSEPVTMPFGLSKTVDNYPMTIALTDIEFTATEAKFNAVSLLALEIFGIEKFAGFGATGLCLSPSGLANMENGGALELIGTLKFNMGDSNFLRILGRSNDTSSLTGTRLVWDCKGFKNIDLKVSLTLDTNTIIPIANKQVLHGQRVIATGHTVISSFNNWLISLDFDKEFEYAGMPGFTYKCRQASLDFSDLANTQGMEFPSGYVGSTGNDWKGFYIKDFGMRLPDAFHLKDTVAGLNFSARNLLIDPSGMSVNFGVDNLLNLNNGSLAGWRFSISRFSLDILQNNLRNAKFNGKIGVPIFDSTLNYQLLFSNNTRKDTMNMNFSIVNGGDIKIPAWVASVTLNQNSKVEILGNFNDLKSWKLQGNFNGNISIGADEIAGMKDIRFGNLPFEGLKIKTGFTSLDSFKFSLDRLGGVAMNRVVSDNEDLSASIQRNNNSEPTKVGGFPVSIQNFSFDNFEGKCMFEDASLPSGNRFGIKFKLLVNIADAGGNGIGGSCKVGIYGTNEIDIEKLWKVKIAGLNVDTISIDAKLSGVVSIKGAIAFVANDPVFGNGVSGMVEAKFPVLSVGVTAMFGEVRGLRYWMVGAKAEFPPIPIDFSANVIYANSISGEAWYHMNRTPGDAASSGAGFQLGKSPSGASFVPDERQLFGFGAALGLTGPPGSPLFGDVGLYAQINTSGGLSKLTMEGNLWMTERDKANAQVLINGNTTIDVDNSKFIGNLTAIVNVGGGAVKGRKKINIEGKDYFQAGSVDLLVDMSKNPLYWHLKVGDPYKTDGKLGFGFYANNKELFSAGGYFMMGSDLPQNLPPMDPDLLKKLEQAKIIIPKNRQKNTSSGFAILMGVDANIPEKKLELGMFYAGVELQIAVDGMLAPFNLNCGSRNGLGGWYMTGRAYAYTNIALGLHVDLPVYKGDIIAAEVNAGMLVDAGIMNPYTFSGQFSANYSILGGLVEGSKRFEFTIHEDESCKPNIPKQSLSFNQLVADISPAKNEEDVIVGVEPVIALNFPYDKEIEYQVSSSKKEKIRIKIEYIRIYEGAGTSNPKAVSYYPMNENHDIRIVPEGYLKASKTQYFIKAKIYAERFVVAGNSGAWSNKMSNDKTWDTIINIGFKTEQFATFSDDYVKYTTPLTGERYFKKDDFSNQGKIVFTNSGAKETFFPNPPVQNIRDITGYSIFYGQFAVAGSPSDTINVPLTFTSMEARFNIPTSLVPDKLYQFRIINERIPPKFVNVSNNNNMSGLTSNISIGNTSGQAPNQNTGAGLNTNNNGQVVPTQDMGGGLVTPQSNPEIFRKRMATAQGDRRIIMHAFVFKVSKYNRIQDKIAALSLPISTVIFSSTDNMVLQLVTDEPFEQYEIEQKEFGTTIIAPQIVSSVSSQSNDDNDWLTDFYRPKVFKAGDTLLKKRNYVTAFIDLSKQKNGVTIEANEHIFGPLPTSSIAFNYDLRLANSKLLQLKNNISNISLASQTMVQNNNFTQSNSGVTMNQQTGMVNGGAISSTNTSSSNTTTSNEPVLGTRLTLKYYFIKNIKDEHSRLVSFANMIISRNPAYWYSGLTSNEISLVSRLISGNQPFVSPSSSDQFTICLHRSSVNNSVQKEIKIKPISISSFNTNINKSNSSFSNTTFSTFK